MFTLHAERLKRRVATMRGAVKSSDMVRALLQETSLDLSGMPALNGEHTGEWLRKYAPDTVAWREFDHNAALTALYAAYECCVNDLLREWVSTVMPVRWPDYNAHLPENTRRSYVVGISKLLPKMGRPERNRYQHLNLTDVARQFADATAGHQPYCLEPDAFLAIDQNLRHGQLQELFNSVGIADVWGWVSKHPLLLDYRDNVIGNANTLENELNKFVQARNDAAHGSTGNYLGATELDQLSRFAERLGIALVERARHDLFDHHLDQSHAEDIGVVSEVLARRGAVIIKASGRPITVGDHFAFFSGNCCDYQPLLSCQRNGIDHPTCIPAADEEVGLRFAELPRMGARLLRFVPTAPVTAVPTTGGTAAEEPSGS